MRFGDRYQAEEFGRAIETLVVDDPDTTRATAS